MDSGVTEGGEVSVYYDPMIAKVITRGASRADAIRRMRGALDAFYIRGISHNIGFLAAVVGHPRFIDGSLTTDFIAEEYGDGFRAADVPHDDRALLAAVAASMHRAYDDRSALISGRLSGHAKKVPREWVVLLGAEAWPVTVERGPGGFDVTVGEVAYEVRTDWALAGRCSVP